MVNAVLSTSGEVAGTCSYHGGRRYTFFIRTASGILTEYGNVFGGTVIFVHAINDHNILAGYYADAAGLAHGFWGDSSGIHSFDYPGDLSTVPMGINLAGTITGFYYDGVDDVRHGFVRDQLGNFTNFDDPNAGTQGTTPLAINRSGQITGQFVGVHLVTHGFLRR